MTALTSRSPWILLAAVALLNLSACARNSYPDFSDLVQEATPSVVNISTISDSAADVEAGAEGSQAPDLENTPFGDWFRRFFDERGETPPPTEQLQAQGSGLILWENGYILTNRHVVLGASEVVVRLWDRRQFTAAVVGMDERSDLALLKIEADGLPAVEIGSSASLRVGEWVLAIGSPFGFDHSATAGIVSAKGRGLYNEQYVPFIQTDVAINPGNSGGPLFNLKGKVVGVNSQIYSQTGSYMGVSFAIPIDVAVKVAQQLRDHGRVARGWLGVVVQEVDRGLAQSFGMEKAVGALVAQVLPDSPSERAGLRVGDVILRFNDTPLISSRSLPPLVGNTDPGETVRLRILREGREVRIDVPIGLLADEGELAQAPVQDGPASRGTVGMVVESLSAEQRSREQIVSGGVRVLQVTPGAAQDAGLRPGDIVLTIGGNEIDSPERLEQVISNLRGGQSVPVLVQRRGAPLFLAMEIPQRR